MDHRLRVKLDVPRQPDRRISRPGLVARFDGARAARLLLLSAPAGFGKTTALVDWIASSGMSSAWLSLDAADNDPARFFGYLWAAVARLDQGQGGNAAGPSEVAGSDPDDAVGEIVAFLAERVEPTVVVLDDYHVIEEPAVQRSVSDLLDHLPAQGHLAISTRADPALPLARLRARAELVEIRAADLRFTPEEATDFLAHRMGVALSMADVEMLVERTEGWPAALQLAGLSLVGRADVAGFVREFAGTHRFVLDFIGEEVLAHLRPDIGEFLLRTSVLDRLTGPLCDALTGRTDGREMLEGLERANLLLFPLDDERRWYRYHRLFADLLRARLAGVNPGGPAALHGTAADWYEAHGFPSDAIEHAIRSGDAARAHGLLRRHSKDFVHAAELGMLRGWLDRLPSEVVRRDAQLSTTYAWTLALAGRTDGVDEHLDDAETAMGGPPLGDAPDPSPVIATQVEDIRSIVARLRGDPVAAAAHAERALRRIPAGLPPSLDAMYRGDAHALLGHALIEDGQADRAADAYRAAGPLLRLAGNRLAVADITRNIARLEARRGRLQAALRACEEALGEEALGEPAPPALAAVNLARAEVLERLGDQRAGAAAQRAIELATRGGDLVTLRDARLLRARLAERAAPGPDGDLLPTSSLVEPLTEREMEVLALVAQGHSNRQIADELYLAVGTVKAHVHAIAGKLGASNRVEAVARARALGILA
jgi:LuxR family maltose regulon positive regulatory protein